MKNGLSTPMRAEGVLSCLFDYFADKAIEKTRPKIHKGYSTQLRGALTYIKTVRMQTLTLFESAGKKPFKMPGISLALSGGVIWAHTPIWYLTAEHSAHSLLLSKCREIYAQCEDYQPTVALGEEKIPTLREILLAAE